MDIGDCIVAFATEKLSRTLILSCTTIVCIQQTLWCIIYFLSQNAEITGWEQKLRKEFYLEITDHAQCLSYPVWTCVKNEDIQAFQSNLESKFENIKWEKMSQFLQDTFSLTEKQKVQNIFVPMKHFLMQIDAQVLDPNSRWSPNIGTYLPSSMWQNAFYFLRLRTALHF